MTTNFRHQSFQIYGIYSSEGFSRPRPVMSESKCGLSCADVNFLQEIEKLKETDAESKQVKILELRHRVALSKSVRERSMSQ